MKSMTGYARATSKPSKGLTWVVEIQSVNRKSLDFYFSIPKEIFFLEVEFRKLIAEQVSRGNITLKISLKKERKSEYALATLKPLKAEWESIASTLGYEKKAVDFPLLLQLMREPASEELFDKETETVLKETVGKALKALVAMKEREGKELSEDIKKRLKKLIDAAERIAKLSKNTAANYREKLLERIEGVLQGATHDERILREVALFADKVDVTEEVTRLKSHFKQALDLFKKDEPAGRTLEFLTQEMLREFNTIGSKSTQIEVVQEVIGAKAELEKIREQVQNLE